MRHETLLANDARMAPQVKNVVRFRDAQRLAVKQRAEAIRRGEVCATA